MDIAQIPLKGHVFAYALDESILFDTYEVIGEKICLSSKGIFCETDYYEYHFFCETKEFRVVTVYGEKKEFCLTEDEETEDAGSVIYIEKQFLKDEYCKDGKQLKLVVVNRFGYNEKDCLYLKDYRLAGVKE